MWTELRYFLPPPAIEDHFHQSPPLVVDHERIITSVGSKFEILEVGGTFDSSEVPVTPLGRVGGLTGLLRWLEVKGAKS